MLQNDSKIYVQLPEPNDPDTLHKGKVISNDAGFINALLEVQLETTDDPIYVVIHHHDGTDFIRHPAKLEVRFSSRTGSGVTLLLLGEGVDAEKRKAARLPVDSAQSPVRLGATDRCSLLDVSVSGSAAASAERHEVGEVVEMELTCNGMTFVGKAEVQNRAPMRDGRFRYGLICLDELGSENTLAGGMQCTAVRSIPEPDDDQASESPFSLPKPRSVR